MKDLKFEEDCRDLRTHIKEIGERVKSLHHRSTSMQIEVPMDGREMAANTMLAYRHLEDAAMRLGKAIQAFDGGVSIYDKQEP